MEKDSEASAKDSAPKDLEDSAKEAEKWRQMARTEDITGLTKGIIIDNHGPLSTHGYCTMLCPLVN